MGDSKAAPPVISWKLVNETGQPERRWQPGRASSLRYPFAHPYQSAFARKYVAKGEAKGRAEDVLTVLRARGIEFTSEAADRILACADLAELDRWIRHAVTARLVGELFG